MNLAKDYQAMLKEIRAKHPGVQPALVALDTLNRSLGGSESKDEDMAAYVNAASAISDWFDCAVTIIHHCGINSERPRGHTSLTGAADAQLACKKDSDGTVSVTVEYMKDGPEGEQLLGRLEVVPLGTDQDGDDITSLVFVDADPGIKPKERNLTPNARRALEALAETVLDHGRTAPVDPHIPDNQRVVEYEQWREQAYKRSGIDKQDAQRKAFHRAVNELSDRKIVGIARPFVWMASDRTVT
jgi:AAA domain